MSESYFKLKEGTLNEVISPYVTDDGKPLLTLEVLDLLNQQRELIGSCENRIHELRNEKKELEKEKNMFKEELESILSYPDEYSLKGEWNKYLSIHDVRDGSDVFLTPTMIVDRLNGLSKENKRLVDENWKLKRANQDLHRIESRLRVIIRENGINLLRDD